MGLASRDVQVNANLGNMENPGVIIVVGVVAALIWAAAARWLLAFSPRGDVYAGVVRALVVVYVRVAHRIRVKGAENIPAGRHPGPLIVVANHTAGLDPMLIQAACPFEIRWMMAADMRVQSLDVLWKWLNVIFVDRQNGNASGSSGAIREAISHLKSGGALGVFPEGVIERPPERIFPFQDGITLLARRSKARVLPVVIDGTPAAQTAWGSLLRTSRARVRFMPIMDGPTDREAAASFADELRARYLEWTGWPAAEAVSEGGEQTS